MNVTVTIGWWVIPACFTAVSFVIAWACTPSPQPSSYFPDFGPLIAGGFYFGSAAILSLAAWLAWSLMA